MLLAMCVVQIGSPSILFGNKKIDCLISEWTEWSVPYGIGEIYRERSILRYPRNGGDECPTVLREINETSKLFIDTN